MCLRPTRKALKLYIIGKYYQCSQQIETSQLICIANQLTDFRSSDRRNYWKFRKFHRKTLGLESLYNKVAGLQVCNFIKERLQHRCFPVKFEKFLRTTFLKNICERLLLSFFFMIIWILTLNGFLSQKNDIVLVLILDFEHVGKYLFTENIKIHLNNVSGHCLVSLFLTWRKYYQLSKSPLIWSRLVKSMTWGRTEISNKLFLKFFPSLRGKVLS